MNELALFAGAGGGILGGHLLGWTTVCAVELEPYPRNVLLQRQRDGLLPPFPIWDDVCTFDGKPWRGLVDVVSGGFPCQDISAAGKGAGIEGARSGLWKEMCRIICEVRPRYAFLENSPMLTSRGLGVVLGDLAEAGYNAAWMVLGAVNVGAPHRRDRIWILAQDGGFVAGHADPGRVCEGVGGYAPAHDSLSNGLQCPQQGGDGGNIPHTHGNRCTTHSILPTELCSTLAETPAQQPHGANRTPGLSSRHQLGNWWRTEPNVGRVAHGVAARVDRLKSIGNGQVPLVAATAFTTLQNKLYKFVNRNS